MLKYVSHRYDHTYVSQSDIEPENKMEYIKGSVHGRDDLEEYMYSADEDNIFPLPENIKKKFAVPVGYEIKAAPMDSGCSTTNVAHAKGFVSTNPCDSNITVADHGTRP